ncbi:MAG: D-TA family PLP-dependent enzyme [Fimbriiglobus sp.]|jgi:D-serine deaminase-like pyridoxal phosphate-dependent protein|nr:D-TA family PLP-dependent enzyme [Fimbriiglobus sp.]
MSHRYHLSNVADIPSPALVFFPEIIGHNIRAVIGMAGGVERLRPHVKTHKTAEVVQMQLLAGVTKHKCATIAEAEMLADAGAPDVLLSYPLVGPNVGRFAKLRQKFPGVRWSVIVDHPATLAPLAAVAGDRPIEVLVDVNMGMDRTGIAIPHVAELYRQIAATPGLTAVGLHCYDGHVNQESRSDREAAVWAKLTPVLEVRASLEAAGLPVPAMICGGTPAFPIYAGIRDIPGLECSPGTYVLHDNGYGSKYPDFTGIEPAAVIVTRVVSRPTPNRVTLDVGNKSIAADPLLPKRVHLLDFPPHTPVVHSEEHYVVETPHADRFTPGDVVYAIPGHVCPTVALHREALVAEGGRVVGAWKVTARDRKLTV